MMNANELNKLVFFMDEASGNIFAAQRDVISLGEIVAGPRISLDAKYANLVTASPMLYQAAGTVSNMIGELIKCSKDVPNNEPLSHLIEVLSDMQSILIMSQTAALNGVIKTFDPKFANNNWSANDEKC